ncbi:hypothetical protein JW926_16370 [Candidatus Sumerlaeota bacterium]|nr:hypothetical protein [Candidatus Sumerlaeota bacterium]
MVRKNLSVVLIWCVIFNVLFPPGIFSVSSPENGFTEVEKALDEGGNYYLYCNTKDSLKQIMDHIKKIFTSPSSPKEAQQALNAIDGVIGVLGFYDIGAFGKSGIPVDDHYITKTFIHIPEERHGILKITGAKPHPFGALEYAPKDTRFAFSMDVNFAELLSIVRECFLKGGGNEAAMEFDNAIANFNTNIARMSGKDATLQSLISSLGEEIVLLIDIDPVMKINIPVSMRESTPFPSPRFALMIRAKDASLYETLSQTIRKIGMAQNEVQDGNIRKTILFAPPNPIYVLQPVLVYDGQYCILTTQLSFLDQILETKKSGGGLKDTEEYKNLVKGLPSEGNGLLFISRDAFTTIQTVFSKFKDEMEKRMGSSEGMAAFPYMGMFSKLEGEIVMGFASVRVNRENGIWEVSKQKYGNAGATTIAMGVAVLGILTAIAVPGFLRARENSRTQACQENLSKIDGAKEQWALENKKQKGAEVRMEDLVGQNLYIRRTPICPRGGTYTLNVIGEDPTCSCGTRLP